MLIRSLKTNFEILEEVRANFKKARIIENITQKELASRAGIAIDVVRRFEQKGSITLKNLIEIARVIDRAEDLLKLFLIDTTINSLTDLDKMEKENKQRMRARK